MTELPECHHRGKIIGTKCECYCDRFAGPDYAKRKLSLCRDRCPFVDKPNRKQPWYRPGTLLATAFRWTGIAWAVRLWSRWTAKPCGCKQRQMKIDRWWVRLCAKLRYQKQENSRSNLSILGDRDAGD